MKRDPNKLQKTEFDVLIIGGGSHGACAARDAALRGLRVALVDKGDICGATSHNSLKTIHGGIRYLQHLNFKRVLESIKEQKIWLRTAPHLVRPLPFLMPTYGYGARGPLAMLAGITLFRLFSLGRNHHLKPNRQLPTSRVLSKQACLELSPEIDQSGLTGGALWYDAQVEHADRAIMQVAEHASELGAVVCNHIKVVSLLWSQSSVVGAKVKDEVTGIEFEVNAKTVLNAAGPWASEILAPHDDIRTNISLIKSMNLVTNRPAPKVAVAVQSSLSSDSVVGNTKRLYFSVPWLNKAVVGTTHFSFSGKPDELTVDHQEIADFIEEINTAYPALKLEAKDILYCYQGLSPEGHSQETNETSNQEDREDRKKQNSMQLHESKVIDHSQNHKVEGLVSIFSVKWTTARLVAEQAIDVICKKLGKNDKGNTGVTPLQDKLNLPYVLSGLSDGEITSFCDAHIEHSMAINLSDVVLRRCNDVVLGSLDFHTLQVVAGHMQARLDWDEEQQKRQLDDLLCHWLPLELRQQFETNSLWSL